MQMLVDGVKTIFGLAEEVNAAAGHQRVKIMDIGGPQSTPLSIAHNPCLEVVTVQAGFR